jgi:hypothetical protein
MKKFVTSSIVAGLAIAMSGEYLWKTLENNRLRDNLSKYQRALENIQQGLPARNQKLQELQATIQKAASVTGTVGRAVAGDVEALANNNNNIKLKRLLSKYSFKDDLPASRSNPQSKESN